MTEETHYVTIGFDEVNAALNRGYQVETRTGTQDWCLIKRGHLGVVYADNGVAVPVRFDREWRYRVTYKTLSITDALSELSAGKHVEVFTSAVNDWYRVQMTGGKDGAVYYSRGELHAEAVPLTNNMQFRLCQ